MTSGSPHRHVLIYTLISHADNHKQAKRLTQESPLKNFAPPNDPFVSGHRPSCSRVCLDRPLLHPTAARHQHSAALEGSSTNDEADAQHAEWRQFRWYALEAVCLARPISPPPSPLPGEGVDSSRQHTRHTSGKTRQDSPPPLPMKSSDMIPLPPAAPSENDLRLTQAKKKRREARSRQKMTAKTAGCGQARQSVEKALRGEGIGHSEHGGANVATELLSALDNEQDEGSTQIQAISSLGGLDAVLGGRATTATTCGAGEEEEEQTERERFLHKYEHLNRASALLLEHESLVLPPPPTPPPPPTGYMD